MADKVSLSIQLVTDSNDTVNVPLDRPLADLLPELLSRLTDGDSVSEAQVAVFIGRIADPSKTLAQLEAQNGDVMHLMILRNIATQTRLTLYLPHNQQVWQEVTQSPSVLGRHDTAMGKVDLDVTPLLPAGKESRVSRRQAILTEKVGRWYIQLHPRATAPVFINATRLMLGREVLLNDNDVILLGDENQPSVRLVARLDA